PRYPHARGYLSCFITVAVVLGPVFKSGQSRSTSGMSRGDLTDEQWERLRPLLPPRQARRGRPPKDHRQIVNGLLWLNRTGVPWRDLPEQYGPWQTVATRFYRWRRAGVWDRVLAELQEH